MPTLELVFEPNHPAGRAVCVGVQTYTCRTNKNEILLTADCVSAGEWDAQLDRLIKELDRIRKSGRKKLSRK